MDAKKAAAEKAVEYIRDGMIVGLGTGSTAYWAIKKIGERVKAGLKIKAVATSVQTGSLARELNIPVLSGHEIAPIDITIDGADEVDRQYNLIKGGGGALLREKIVAANSKQFLVIVDESKMVEQLGKFPLPVELVSFASALTLQKIRELGCSASIRIENGEEYKTDNGNLVADCRFTNIPDPATLNRDLHLIPGIVETGLFLNSMVSHIIIGNKDGTTRILTPQVTGNHP